VGLTCRQLAVILILLLADKASAEKLSVQVNEAVHLLTDYNGRLAAEMEYRKKLTTMLRDFLQAQKDLLAQAEHRLEVRTHWCLSVERTGVMVG
jgi:regulator of Ty1 transposition protein 103